MAEYCYKWPVISMVTYTYHVWSSYDCEVATGRGILERRGLGRGGKGAGHVRGGKVNASHYDVCTTLLGTGWPYVILSSIGWRPALIQRVSRENSGQTELEERERVMQYNKAFFFFFRGVGRIRKMAFSY